MKTIAQRITDILSTIHFKDGKSLAEVASQIIIKDNNIGFSINIECSSHREGEDLRQKAIEAISKIEGLGKISIILTSASGQGSAQSKSSEFINKPKHHINNVGKVILVASGKGGVGKSTIAVALAENLVDCGYKIGLVDADIYGPSIPLMFHLRDKPEIHDGKIIPLSSRGLQLNSIGFLTNNDSPLAWRGPMASKAIYQLLSLSLWSNLDYLIIDMPPGTGDIHLAILTNYHIDGVVAVTTPQKISAIDTAKSIELYQKFQIPILALIENMSYFVDSNNQKIEIFKGGQAKMLSDKYNIPCTYQIPINPEIGIACDEGLTLKNLIKIPEALIRKL
jgi:ATP-binding protein involved in chromosome partitioning